MKYKTSNENDREDSTAADVSDYYVLENYLSDYGAI